MYIVIIHNNSNTIMFYICEKLRSFYALAMITTLMPHLRIGPYKVGVTIDQIQSFHTVGRSFSYELLIILKHVYITLAP